MYEISGGAVLKYHSTEIELEKQDKAINEFLEQMEKHFEVGEYNYLRCENTDSFSVVAIKKESYNSIVEIFQWIAENLPGSIGSLDVHDVEYMEKIRAKGDNDDIKIDNENKIIVYNLKEGKLTKVEGPLCYAMAYIGNFESSKTN